ncbi:NUDIX hydrolase [Streptomyces misionensis]|uniref:NUDIX hydrolase n=1 Tax=Streptomyces misionensis TaxID=67331 RepID=UPI0036CFF5F4
MPPTRSHTRATTEAYLTRHPQETDALAGLFTLLDGPAEPTSRTTLPGHITCSAAVVDRNRRVLWFTVDMLDRVRLSSGLGSLIRRHAAEHPTPGGPRTKETPPAPRRGGGVPSRRAELHIVGVHLLLRDDDERILLGLRHPDSAYGGGRWHMPAGHCERESAVACLVREAREEANLVIDPAQVEFVHLVHHAGPDDARPRLQLFFQAHAWSGTSEVREPDRCLEWRWWAPESCPAELVPYTRTAIADILAGRTYAQRGWT